MNSYYISGISVFVQMDEKEIECMTTEDSDRTIDWYKLQLMKMRKLFSELEIELDKLNSLRRSVGYFAFRRGHCHGRVITTANGDRLECDGVSQDRGCKHLKSDHSNS